MSKDEEYVRTWAAKLSKSYNHLNKPDHVDFAGYLELLGKTIEMEVRSMSCYMTLQHCITEVVTISSYIGQSEVDNVDSRQLI